FREGDARVEAEVGYRSGEHCVARAGVGEDARGDVHRDAADITIFDLTFAGMQAGADLQAKRTRGLANRLGTADGPPGTIEGGGQVVARHGGRAPAETRELLPGHRLIRPAAVAPAAVAEPDCDLGRLRDL